jgi:hypothetical protein
MRVSKNFTKTSARSTVEAKIGSVGSGMRAAYAEDATHEHELCVHFSLRQIEGGVGVQIILTPIEAKALAAGLIRHADRVINETIKVRDAAERAARGLP